MRKLSLLGLTILLFIACQNKPQRYFDDSPEINTVKAGIKAYETGDWDTWKSNFADSAKIFHNSSKGSSPDEVMANFKQMLKNIESYKFADEGEVSEMVIDKDGKTWVNYWGYWMGTTKVTSKKIGFPVHLTLEFVDGKIVQEYGYYDTASINTAFAEIAETKVAEMEETASKE